MTDYYRIPTLVLLSILVAVFASLYARSRTPRRLLWLLGWCMAVVRIAVEIGHVMGRPWGLALGNFSLTAAALMFLGSMSPLTFGKRFRIHCVVAYGVPLLLFSVLASFYPDSHSVMRVVIELCCGASVLAAVAWSAKRFLLPKWFTILFSSTVGIAALYFAWQQEYNLVLYMAQAATNVITAMLFVATFRRWSAGVVFSAAGFVIWALPILLHSLHVESVFYFTLTSRAVNLVKVMTAMGMIVLVLEDELATNEAAKQRDRRARVELERYSQLDVSILQERGSEGLYDRICQCIVEASRFGQAILFFRGIEQHYTLAGRAGVDGALAGALESLGARLTEEELRSFGKSSSVSVELGNTFVIDIRSLFVPGDELERLNFLQARAIPIRSSAGHMDGALLLAGVRNPDDALRTDDVLPLELLMARVMAARENHALMRRVMRAESLASVGQLAGGVAHELNNPLTVVMGYAELLEEDPRVEETTVYAGIIRRESLRMKRILESLIRFWRPSPSEQLPVAIDQLLLDIQSLRQPEFDRRGIDFRLTLAPDLPLVTANLDQMRQVFLHVLNNAVEAVTSPASCSERQIRVNASCSRDRLQILVSDSGPGLQHPNRIFDPFYTTKQPGAGPGLGLSICYAIIREHGGEITAFNLQPHGAALVIEIPGRPVLRRDQVAGSVFAL